MLWGVATGLAANGFFKIAVIQKILDVIFKKKNG